MKPRRLRLTEALLLFCGAIVLLVGALLAVVAKTPGNTPVLLNTATAPELTKALGGDTALAQRVLTDRAKNGFYSDVDALARRKVLVSPQLKAFEPALTVLGLVTRLAAYNGFVIFGSARCGGWISILEP